MKGYFLMNILSNMNSKFIIEAYDRASTELEVKEMIETSPIVIPKEYIEIIKEKSEVEISICGEKIFRIWGALGCIEMNEVHCIQEYLPDVWAIGDDEGEFLIVYSSGINGTGIYAVLFSDLEEDAKNYSEGGKTSINLPEYDGTTTHGVMVLDNGTQVPFVSGNGDPRYTNYAIMVTLSRKLQFI